MSSTPQHHHHRHGATQVYGRAFAIATGINLAFVLVELVAGVWSGSMALLADAAHNLGDVGGLALAWGASVLARRPPTTARTYGYGKATILAGLANAILVLLAVGGVCWEAVGRLSDPPEVHAPSVIVVAAIGVVVNGVGAALFMRGRDDLNVRGAFVHLMADAAVSLGVVVSGVVLMYTDWRWIDPAVSLGVSVVILVWAWKLLRDSLKLATDAVPEHVDVEAVRAYLESLPDVTRVHDLHVWPMSANETAMTAHLVMPDDSDRARILADVGEEMRQRHGICHCTIQIEPRAAHQRRTPAQAEVP